MGEHVVIAVDDNTRYLSACGRLLRRRGFVPILCASYAEACREIDATTVRPEAAIFDLVLDSRHLGSELRDRLDLRFTAAVPAIIVSAYSEIHEVVPKSNVQHIDLFLLSAAIRAITLKDSFAHSTVLSFTTKHHLCPADARIVARLFIGATRSSLADALEISDNTLKSQIRRLLKRSGATAVDELIARLLQYSSELRMAENACASASLCQASSGHREMDIVPCS